MICKCGNEFIKTKFSHNKCDDCSSNKCANCDVNFSWSAFFHGNSKCCSKDCLYAFAASESPNEFSSVIKDAFAYECAICKYSNVVQFHHIIPLSRGGKSEIKNCIPLCPNHHAEFHVGILKEESVLFYRNLLSV